MGILLASTGKSERPEFLCFNFSSLGGWRMGVILSFPPPRIKRE